MMRTQHIAALALASMAASGAYAIDIPYTGPVQTVHATQAIEVLGMVREGNKIKLTTGRVVDLAGEARPQSTQTNMMWDGIEADPALLSTGFTPYSNPAYGGDCTTLGGNQGARFFSGDLVPDGGFMQDFTVLPGFNGKLCTRIGHEFYLNTAPLLNFAFAAIIGMSENVVTGPSLIDPNQAANRGDVGTTWLVTYTGVANGFAYIGDIDFGAQTVNGWTMPADGHGAIRSQLGDYDSATNTITLGVGQNMRWVNKIGNPTVADMGFIWRDRLILNGMWDGLWNSAASNEYESRATTVCPGVVKNSTVGLSPYTRLCCDLLNSPPAVLAPTSFSVGLGSVISGDNTSLSADDANALKLCKAFVPNFASPRMRFDAEFLSPYTSSATAQVDLKARMTTGGSFKVRAFLADTSGTDTFVYGGANQVIADTTINLTFAVYSSGPVSATNHIDNDVDTVTDGTMRTRVEIQQTGFSAVFVPCSEFEYLNVTVAF